MNFELSNKGYQALAEEQDAAFQEQQVNTDENDDDDLPPPYPHDMSAFEGYPTVGFCNPVPGCYNCVSKFTLNASEILKSLLKYR